MATTYFFFYTVQSQEKSSLYIITRFAAFTNNENTVWVENDIAPSNRLHFGYHSVTRSNVVAFLKITHLPIFYNEQWKPYRNVDTELK